MRLKNKYAQFYLKNYDLEYYELKVARFKGKNLKCFEQAFIFRYNVLGNMSVIWPK